MWIVRASGWLVFLLKPISRVKDSHPSWCLERPLRAFMELSWSFNGVLFAGVSYRKSCGFFYCSTLSQLFPIFTPYSCKWRDCALGELLSSLVKIIMIIILHYNLYSLCFMFIILSGLNTQNNSCKNVEQWRNIAISPIPCCKLLQSWWNQIYVCTIDDIWMN